MTNKNPIFCGQVAYMPGSIGYRRGYQVVGSSIGISREDLDFVESYGVPANIEGQDFVEARRFFRLPSGKLGANAVLNLGRGYDGREGALFSLTLVVAEEDYLKLDANPKIFDQVFTTVKPDSMNPTEYAELPQVRVEPQEEDVDLSIIKQVARTTGNLSYLLESMVERTGRTVVEVERDADRIDFVNNLLLLLPPGKLRIIHYSTHSGDPQRDLPFSLVFIASGSGAQAPRGLDWRVVQLAHGASPSNPSGSGIWGVIASAAAQGDGNLLKELNEMFVAYPEGSDPSARVKVWYDEYLLSKEDYPPKRLELAREIADSRLDKALSLKYYALSNTVARNLGDPTKAVGVFTSELSFLSSIGPGPWRDAYASDLRWLLEAYPNKYVQFVGTVSQDDAAGDAVREAIKTALAIRDMAPQICRQLLDNQALLTKFVEKPDAELLAEATSTLLGSGNVGQASALIDALLAGPRAMENWDFGVSLALSCVHSVEFSRLKPSEKVSYVGELTSSLIRLADKAAPSRGVFGAFRGVSWNPKLKAPDRFALRMINDVIPATNNVIASEISHPASSEDKHRMKEASDAINKIHRRLTGGDWLATPAETPESAEDITKMARTELQSLIKRTNDAASRADLSDAAKMLAEGTDRLKKKQLVERGHFLIGRSLEVLADKLPAEPRGERDMYLHGALDRFTKSHSDADAERIRKKLGEPPKPVIRKPPPEPSEDPLAFVRRLAETVDLSEYQVVGDYVRFDPHTRDVLMNVKEQILDSLEGPSRQSNFLIWGKSASGKSFLIEQIATVLPASTGYRRLDLAKPEVDKAKFEAWISELGCATQPLLVFLDEVDSDRTESWSYAPLLPILNQGASGQTKRCFVLAGSSCESMEDMKAKLGRRDKGRDLLSRIPLKHDFAIPAMTTGDRAIVALLQFVAAGRIAEKEIRLVEKLALYYVMKKAGLENMRKIRDFATDVVKRVHKSDNRIRYANLFDDGDEEEYIFREEAKNLGLSGEYVTVKPATPFRPSKETSQATEFPSRSASPVVFIAHSFSDDSLKDRLETALREKGIVPYAAEERLELGITTVEKIKTKIRESDYVIAVYTRGHPSPSVDEEVGMALILGKPVIPIAEKGAVMGEMAKSLDRAEFDEKNFDRKCEEVAEGISLVAKGGGITS